MKPLKPTFLRCEYAQDPIGVQPERPVLSWLCQSDSRGARQTAYRIAAASTAERLSDDNYDLWDTGKVEIDRFMDIRYGGKPLASAERVYWKVMIWDEKDEPSLYSDPAFFEMGLLNRSDWKGRWMGFLGGMIGNGILLRFPFSVAKKPARARVYICGLGYYELRLNGAKVGDKLLDPGATDTSKTLLYSAYDVTSKLRIGTNVVGVVLGTGWIGMPKALLQLNIDYEDGTRQEVFTDWGIGWLVARGPITYNSIYDGEDYDARMEKDGWDTPEYGHQALLEHQRPGGWILATCIEEPGGKLIGEVSPPVRVTGTAKPEFMYDLPDGRKLYDIGINQTGWIRLKTHGSRGSRLSLTFSEVLDSAGDLDMVFLRTARCQDNYILRGDKETEEYAPRFTYHGFRYFTVKTEGDAVIDSMTMEFVRSDLPKNSEFSCSDEFVNRLSYVMWHTDACNMMSIPTDSSQRDERHGWTTDTTAREEGSTYHFDLSGFFDKWARDIFDTQDHSGYFADTAPHRWGRRPCDPQVNTPISLPLLLYRVYGNKRNLEEHFDDMKRYVLALKNESDHLLISRTGFGEWACPEAECYPEPYGAGAVSMHVTAALVSTGYFYLSVTQLMQMAQILGKTGEAEELKNLAEAIYKKYNDTFFHPETAQYDMGSQSSNALSLQLGLVPEKYRKAVAENIVRDLAARDYHLTTGNMGTKAIVDVLCEFGMDDAVYRFMTQRTSPSFGYMLDQGATSIWERWEADRNNNIMNSHNQPMLASSCVWFYKYLGGIRFTDDTAAFKSLLVEPSVPTQLTHAKTRVNIPAGPVKTEWKRRDGSFALTVEMPFNTRASVVIRKSYAHEKASLYEGGAKLDLNSLPAGVYGIKENDACYTVEIGSGAFEFVLK